MEFVDFIKSLLNQKKEFFSGNFAYIFSDIPEKKKKTVLDDYSFPKGEEILWLVDNTLSGTAKDNTVLTNFGIYFRQKIFGILEEKKVFWTDIEDVFFTRKKGFVFLTKKGEEVSFDPLHFGVVRKSDSERINAILGAFKEILDFIKLNRIKTPESDNEKKLIEDINIFLSNDLQITDAERRILDKLRQKYGISEKRFEDILQNQIKNFLSSDEYAYLDEVINIYREINELDKEHREILDHFANRLQIDLANKERLEKLAKFLIKK